MRDEQEKLLRAIDMDYSLHLAEKMETYASNPVLGFRTAGSEAARRTGDMLAEEMRALGLSNVRKDEITVDGWEFRTASLAWQSAEGTVAVQLGAYQTDCVTQGEETLSLVYLKKGEAKDYEGRDVRGKLVLADINQRDEWWINYPVYQAHLKGARGLIAVQRGGYGDVDDASLNAQDISGPTDAPAFSISRRDADRLLEAMGQAEELTVSLTADSRVLPHTRDWNIVGELTGEHPERMVLLSAHYDSYFSGFQDDNTAVSMMLGIAKALRRANYKPRNTLVFCAMAAEEWGVADSCFDWSTGAYEQVFTVHPEWRGKVIADLNFELPALAHGSRDRIRSCYALSPFLRETLQALPPLTPAYPRRTTVVAPIETWSDDFSMAIAGIPSMVNDFTGGSFMSTHYHSQFDDRASYDPAVYRLHHEQFLLLLEALDRTCVAPLCFTGGCERALKRVARDADTAKELAPLRALWQEKRRLAQQEYAEVRRMNHRYAALLDDGQEAEAEALYQACRDREARLLRTFQAMENDFVRVDWNFNVACPHELLLSNIEHLEDAASHLRAGRVAEALHAVYQVDNNAYAFTFDEGVYEHFTSYVFDQAPERLKWGCGRVLPHENLYGVVKSLLHKQKTHAADFRPEEERIADALHNQHEMLRRMSSEMLAATED